jgi:acetyltransferase-like isoleucine patch superfamily enzyme
MALLARIRTWGYKYVSLAQRVWYTRLWGMKIGDGVRISRSAKLDRTNPSGINIGNHTLISFDVAILTHDFVKGRHVETHIGDYCFIGARSIIMPGVKIGNHCVIGAGAVVISDVPDHSIAAGNPARILRSDIVTGRWGIMNPKFLALEGIIPAPRHDS